MEHDECPNCKKIWDMATKAERDRCAKIARDCHGCSGSQTAKEILNPAPANEGTEGRES